MTTPYGSQYRTKFASVSFGTEQELKGVFIEMAGPNLPDVIAEVSKGGNVLVEITKDLADPPGTNRHVVELRTTPTELSDGNGWFDRLQALWVAVSYVEGGPNCSSGRGRIRRICHSSASWERIIGRKWSRARRESGNSGDSC